MAVRKKIRHDDETRAKIQAAQIINRMHSCVMGEITLDAQQVSCAKALLNKVLPDLATTTLQGAGDDGAIIVQIQRFAENHRPSQ